MITYGICSYYKIFSGIKTCSRKPLRINPTIGVHKRVRCTNLYYPRQCYVVFKPRSDHTDHTVVCFVMHDCSRKIAKTVGLPVQDECGLINDDDDAYIKPISLKEDDHNAQCLQF